MEKGAILPTHGPAPKASSPRRPAGRIVLICVIACTFVLSILNHQTIWSTMRESLMACNSHSHEQKNTEPMVLLVQEADEIMEVSVHDSSSSSNTGEQRSTNLRRQNVGFSQEDAVVSTDRRSGYNRREETDGRSGYNSVEDGRSGYNRREETNGRSGYNSVEDGRSGYNRREETDGRSGYNSVEDGRSGYNRREETDGRSGYNNVEDGRSGYNRREETDGRSGYNSVEDGRSGYNRAI